MRVALALCLLLLAACGSLPDVLTRDATPAAAPAGSYWITIQDRHGLTPEERERLFDRVAARLGTGKVAMGTPGAMELRITVTSYRMFEEGARQASGMVGGVDHVESVVQVIDPGSRAVRSEERVLTRNRRVVATTTLLELHGEDIVDSLSR